MTVQIPPSAATLRAFNTFQKAIGKETLKADAKSKACRKAIADTVDAWLETLPAADRARFFAQIEALATAPNARKITTHPMRDDEVTGMVEKIKAKDEAEKGSKDNEAAHAQ